MLVKWTHEQKCLSLHFCWLSYTIKLQDYVDLRPYYIGHYSLNDVQLNKVEDLTTLSLKTHLIYH